MLQRLGSSARVPVVVLMALGELTPGTIAAAPPSWDAQQAAHAAATAAAAAAVMSHLEATVRTWPGEVWSRVSELKVVPLHSSGPEGAAGGTAAVSAEHALVTALRELLGHTAPTPRLRCLALEGAVKEVVEGCLMDEAQEPLSSYNTTIQALAAAVHSTWQGTTPNQGLPAPELLPARPDLAAPACWAPERVQRVLSSLQGAMLPEAALQQHQHRFPQHQQAWPTARAAAAQLLHQHFAGWAAQEAASAAPGAGPAAHHCWVLEEALPARPSRLASGPLPPAALPFAWRTPEPARHHGQAQDAAASTPTTQHTYSSSYPPLSSYPAMQLQPIKHAYTTPTKAAAPTPLRANGHHPDYEPAAPSPAASWLGFGAPGYTNGQANGDMATPVPKPLGSSPVGVSGLSFEQGPANSPLGPAAGSYTPMATPGPMSHIAGVQAWQQDPTEDRLQA